MVNEELIFRRGSGKNHTIDSISMKEVDRSFSDNQQPCS